MGPGRRSPWIGLASWAIFACGMACFFFAEAWLVEVAYFAFGEFALRWWLGLSLMIPIFAIAALTGLAAVRYVRGYSRKCRDRQLLKLAAICLGLGIVEIVVSVAIAIVALILLPGGFQVVPVIHVR
jgi:hypothetical protein